MQSSALRGFFVDAILYHKSIQPTGTFNWWSFSVVISALISHNVFVLRLNISLPPSPHNEAPDVQNILPSSRVRAPHLLLLFSLHLKAPVWSLTKDNARCPMLTKAPSVSWLRERKRKSTLSLCPNEAPDQDHAEVESGVGSCLRGSTHW